MTAPLTDRHCMACGELLVRREGERPYKFNRRRCCNRTCGTTAGHGQTTAPPRQCTVCAKVLVRRDGERSSDFHKRRCCDYNCSSIAGRIGRTARLDGAPSPERYCVACEEPLVQRDGEKNYDYNKRRCCNYTCASIAGHMGRPRNPICRYCGERPRVQTNDHKIRATCGDANCLAAARDGRNTLIHWPAVTGEIAWDGAFAKHNRDPGDGGLFRMMRPATHVETMSASALAAREGDVR